MAELTHPKSTFASSSMPFMGPGDGGMFPGVSNTALGPTGRPLKRAKVMRTTGTDIVTTANYGEYGGKATDQRHFHHGETTSFTPVTATLSTVDVRGEGLAHNSLIPPGTVLCGSKLKVRVGWNWAALSAAEMPLPIVNEAFCTKGRMGTCTAALTVAVEGRALINRKHLADSCDTWKQGDKLYWRLPTDARPYWTLEKTASNRPDSHYHAILYNGLVGGKSQPSGFVLVFIVAMP